MKRTLKITGLDCAGCAAELEEELAKIEGVTNVSVSFVNQKITVEHETAAALSKVIEYANGFEEVKVLEDLPLGATVFTSKISIAPFARRRCNAICKRSRG